MRDQNMSFADESKYQPSAKRQKASMETNRGDNFEEPRRKTEPAPNHILLMTVLNPVYSITTDIIYTISNPYGQVLRIVIFKKNGVQALVEFDSIDTAKRAKEALQGADIYSGCCTLKVEFGKPSKLNVYKNDNDSWDYTNPNIGRERESSDNRRPALLPDPRNAGPSGASFQDARPGRMNYENPDSGEGGRGYSGAGSYHNGTGYSGGGGYGSGGYGSPGGSYGNGGGSGGYGRSFSSSVYSRYLRGEDSYDGRGGDMSYGMGTTMGGGMLPPPQGIPQGSPVVMVYGMSQENMNADKIFNLFCLYGNVLKVKFLKSKEGCAMVQMGDSVSADRVIQNLRNSTFFGKTLSLAFSNQPHLNDVPQPYNLYDGSPSYKDFMGNKYNRFLNPDSAAKCRITPPSKILHFYNCPTSMTEEDLSGIFMDAKQPEPITVKIFNTKSERSSSGLAEFDSISDALEALVTCNHTPIPSQVSQFPYIMKLCFSSSRQGIKE